jgi:translation initiation factor 4E
MASEVAMAANTEVAAVAVAAEEETVTTKVPHKLERKWTFWFDNQSKPKQGAAWGTSLRKLYTFETVEEFWWYAFQFYPPPPLSLSLSLALVVYFDIR